MFRSLLSLWILSIACLTSHFTHAATLNRGFAWPIVVGDLDPHTTSSDTLLTLITHYLEPLLRMGPKGEILPGLAERWTVSEDGKLITLHLNKNARWSSGEPLTAQQVKQSIERAVSNYGTSDARPLLLPLRGVTEHLRGDYSKPLGITLSGQHEVRFELTHNRPDFLKVLAFPITTPVPIHQIGNDNSYPTLEKLDSSGPYKLIKREKHNVKFEINSDYFLTPPYYSTINFQFGDYQDLVKQFFNESLDLLEFIPVTQISWLKEKMPEQLVISGDGGAFYLVVSTAILGEKNSAMRKYLLNSVDVTRLNDIMTKGIAPVTSSIIPWEQAPLPDHRKFLQEGRRLAEKLGYSKEKPLSLCIHLRKSDANNIIYNFLKATWANLHIKLTPDYRDKEIYNGTPACPMIYYGYKARTQSADEITLVFAHTEGGLYPWLAEDWKVLEADNSILPNSRRFIESAKKSLRETPLAQAIYGTSVISLVNKKKAANYIQSRNNLFIPLSNLLHP